MGERRRGRDVVLEVVLPADVHGAPLSSRDLSVFWARFQQVAPAHLRLGMAVATLALVHIAPRLTGHVRSLVSLTPNDREDVLQRVVTWPVFGDLAEVAKIVACMAYFDDDAVQARVRGPAA